VKPLITIPASLGRGIRPRRRENRARCRRPLRGLIGGERPGSDAPFAGHGLDRLAKCHYRQ